MFCAKAAFLSATPTARGIALTVDGLSQSFHVADTLGSREKRQAAKKAAVSCSTASGIPLERESDHHFEIIHHMKTASMAGEPFYAISKSNVGQNI